MMKMVFLLLVLLASCANAAYVECSGRSHYCNWNQESWNSFWVARQLLCETGAKADTSGAFEVEYNMGGADLKMILQPGVASKNCFKAFENILYNCIDTRAGHWSVSGKWTTGTDSIQEQYLFSTPISTIWYQNGTCSDVAQKEEHVYLEDGEYIADN